MNKTLGQVDVNNVFARTITHPKITGIAGDVVEQSILGYLLCIIFEEPSPKAQLQLHNKDILENEGERDNRILSEVEYIFK